MIRAVSPGVTVQQKGRVQIHPDRATVKEPTFASHSECLQHYLANDVATTGLVTRPTACILLPGTTSTRAIQHTAGAPVDCLSTSA